MSIIVDAAASYTEKPEADTSLHAMGGPTSATPAWVMTGWDKARAKRLRIEREAKHVTKRRSERS